jgi:uncharacterized protein YkwD
VTAHAGLRTRSVFAQALAAISIVALLGPASAGAGARALAEDAVARVVADPAAETALLTLLNRYRTAKHLPALKLSPRLHAAAEWYAVDMAVGNSFSHTHVDSLGRQLGDRVQSFGYWWRTAEATAEGLPTPASALARWKASPGHDAILRDPVYRDVGVGAAADASGVRFWVATVGSGPQTTGVTIVIGLRRRR